MTAFRSNGRGTPGDRSYPRLQLWRRPDRKGPVVMLPITDDIPVIRTDFSDQEAWEAVSAAVLAPGDAGGFPVHVEFVDDIAFRDLTPRQLLGLDESRSAIRHHPCLFVVDRATLGAADRPVLVIDVQEEPGRTFRAVAESLHEIESNLATDNMDLYEFAAAVGPDGVFRGLGAPAIEVMLRAVRDGLKSHAPGHDWP